MVFKILTLMIMIISSIEDIRKKEIPVWEIAACGLISAASCIFGALEGNLDAMGVFLSVIPGAAILFIALMSGQSVGYGDGFLLLAAGPSLGPEATAIGLLIALFAGGIFSGVLVALKKAGRRSRFPFVPFMTFGMGAMILEKI